VAKSESNKDARTAPRGIGRHLEGWQPGLLAVMLAGSAALLAVPRSVEPEALPAPILDPRRLSAAARADDALARLAEEKPLDVDVRALGSLLRAFGRADASGDEAEIAELRGRIDKAAGVARSHGDAELAALRAFQLRSFLREVYRFVTIGETSDELIELAGPFPNMLARNGWCEGAAPCSLRMDEAALRASFKRRWNEISGLSGGALDLDVEEQRALYRFLLEHPPLVRGEGSEVKPERSSAGFLLKKVDELAAIDARYPRDLARGVVLFRQGEYRRAAESFATHLERSPDGSYTLRAQNYLRASLERAIDDTP